MKDGFQGPFPFFPDTFSHPLTCDHAYESLPITGRRHIRVRGPPAALRVAVDAAEPGLRPPRRLCLPAQVGFCLNRLITLQGSNLFEHMATLNVRTQPRAQVVRRRYRR